MNSDYSSCKEPHIHHSHGPALKALLSFIVFSYGSGSGKPGKIGS